MDHKNSTYQPPDGSLWKGRPAKAGNQYWYQNIQLLDIEDDSELNSASLPEFALLGYACDEGVRRNFGRTGAKEGPDALRSSLAKLAFHHQSPVADLGNVVIKEEDMEAGQQKLASITATLIRKKVFPIIIGGGHDLAYGHFKGLWKSSTEEPRKSSIGIINFDAHFDLRPPEKRGNSGTPFYQILDEHGSSVEYFVMGIQTPSNSRQLFDIARRWGVRYVYNFDCHDFQVESVVEELAHFIEGKDRLYISIDLDGFSSAYAPGVSAPSPLGFHPFFFFRMLKFLLATRKVMSCDIVELNPEYDRDRTTATLAARIVDYIVEYKP